MATVTSSSAPALVTVVETKVIMDKPKPFSKSAAKWCSAHWRALLGELLATIMLVLFGCMSGIPIEGLSERNPIYSPLAFGLTVLFNVQIFGHISGAFMNPAVTLASVIFGITTPVLGICYFAVEVLGALIGYGILVGLAPIDIRANGICVTMPHHGLDDFQALGVELILTATLVFLCCSLWDPVNQDMQDSAPIKFGLAIVGLSVVGTPLTGSSSNPARSFAPALWSGTWTSHWIYWVGPFIGSALTATIYKTVFLQNKNENYT